MLAEGLAAIAPGETSVLPMLTTRLNQALREPKPPFYPAGTLANALGHLADPASANSVAATLDAALTRSARFLRKDRSAVLDFQRRVQAGADALSKIVSSSSARSLAARRTAAKAVDAEYAAVDDAPPPALPSLSFLEPAPHVRARAMRAPERSVLDEARAHATAIRRREKVSANAKPERIARLVDDEVQRMRSAWHCSPYRGFSRSRADGYGRSRRAWGSPFWWRGWPTSSWTTTAPHPSSS